MRRETTYQTRVEVDPLSRRGARGRPLALSFGLAGSATVRSGREYCRPDSVNVRTDAGFRGQQLPERDCPNNKEDSSRLYDI